MSQPGYVSTRARRGYQIETDDRWGTFKCYPIKGEDREPRYSFPGGRAYTAAQLFELGRMKGWRVTETRL